MCAPSCMRESYRSTDMVPTEQNGSRVRCDIFMMRSSKRCVCRVQSCWRAQSLPMCTRSGSVIWVVSIQTRSPMVDPSSRNHIGQKGDPRRWLMTNGFASASMMPTHSSVRHTKLLHSGYSLGTYVPTRSHLNSRTTRQQAKPAPT